VIPAAPPGRFKAFDFSSPTGQHCLAKSIDSSIV
jgi:hypothetical protein